MNAAHIHLMMTHVPVIGTFAALGLLAFAFARKSQELKKAALGILVVAALFAGEMSRQFPTAVALGAAFAGGALFDLRLLSQLRGQGGDVITVEQQELIRIDPFLLRAIQTPEQPGDLVLLLVDLLLLRLDGLFEMGRDGGRLSELLLEALTFAQQERLQQGGIIGQ